VNHCGDTVKQPTGGSVPADEFQGDFGAALRQARLNKGMSLRELGERTHYSKGHLSKVENGVAAAHPDLARACDAVLGTGGTLAQAIRADRSRREPGAGMALGLAPSGRGRPDPEMLLGVLSAGLTSQPGGRSRRESMRYLITEFLAAASAADAVLSPGRYRPPVPPDTAPPDTVPGDTVLAGTVVADALSWCEGVAGVVSFLCSVAFELQMDEECWRLAYAFRGYFFATGALGPWIASHKVALQAAGRSGDQWAVAVTRNNLGLALLEQGRASAAEAEHGAALAAFRCLGDDHGVATTLGHQAWASHAAGRHGPAIDLATAANQVNRALGSERRVAVMDRTAALAHAKLGQHAQAMACLAECREILAGADLPLDAAMLANCLGEAHFAKGDFAAAARYHVRAAELAAACGGLAEQGRAERLYRRAASISSTVFASPWVISRTPL
jgi:transcriptional regulator with XRE-family HTH domain